MRSRKKALVIGVDKYLPRSEGLQLNTCINDATSMSKALSSIGFAVQYKLDCSLKSMKLAANQLVNSIQKDDIVLFYYSGHGCEYFGHTYATSSDLRGMYWGNIMRRALDVQQLLFNIHTRNPGLVIMIVDCCRYEPPLDPIPLRTADARSDREKASFIEITTPPSTILAYATRPGQAALAMVGNRRNSLYTHHLLKYITEPKIGIHKVFWRAANALENDRLNEGNQTAFLYSSCQKSINIVSGKLLGFDTIERRPVRKFSIEIKNMIIFDISLGILKPKSNKKHVARYFSGLLRVLYHRGTCQSITT